jgi:hypothetical protein
LAARGELTVDFDLQGIWTTAGASAAVLIIGYVFGFLQSVLPVLPSTGVFRTWTLTIITAGIVLLAAITSGKTLEDPNAIGNLFSGFLVFLGLQRMAIASSDAGTTTAINTSNGKPLEVKPPDATVADPYAGG